MLNKAKIYINFIFALLLTANLADAEATLKFANNKKNIKWQKPSINICLSQEASKINNIQYALENSMQSWNKLQFIPRFTNLDTDCEINIRLQKIKWHKSPAPLATTVIIHNIVTAEAVNAEIVINDFYLPTIGDSAIDPNMYDLQSILTHELGHTLGLDEDYTDKYSSMFILTEKGTIHKRLLNKSDITAISKIYKF